MDVSIQRMESVGKVVWQVSTCGSTFSFTDQASAIAFADKLKERVEADHCIPEAVLQRWADEHDRMLDDGLS